MGPVTDLRQAAVAVAGADGIGPDLALLLCWVADTLAGVWTGPAYDAAARDAARTIARRIERQGTT